MTAEVIEIGELNKPNVSPQMIARGYHKNECIWMLPTRGMIPLRVVCGWRYMAWLPNTARAHIDLEGMEVAAAYNQGFEWALERADCKGMPWVFTYEEDNVQPRDVFTKLFAAIWKCIDCDADMPSAKDGSPAEPWICPNGHRGLDAVAGLYRTKTDPSMWMAFGDPKNPSLDFRPIDISDAMERGGLVEVNGIAQGSTLFRKKIFEKISRPWFKTVAGAEAGARTAYTQDMYFCRKAKEELGLDGVRFAVHCGVSVAHLDIETGEVY